jgi:hypothetical protein
MPWGERASRACQGGSMEILFGVRLNRPHPETTGLHLTQ